MRAYVTYQPKFKRRRQGLTNYAKRLALVKSGFERVVVRKTNKRIVGQIIKYGEKGDVVITGADSNELRKEYSWPSRSNKPTAYLTGLLLAKKAKGAGEMILDIGVATPVKNSIPFVFAKGCVDGGMKLKGSFEVKGEEYDASRIAKYAELLKKEQQEFKRQFGGYVAGGVEPESLPKLFNEVKEKIMNRKSS